MFTHLGRLIARRPGTLILIWTAILAGSAVWAFLAEPPPAPTTDSLLPPDSPYNQAVETVHREFPQLAARSRVAIVGHRSGGLTADDLTWLATVARESGKAAAQVIGDPSPGRVMTPDVAYLKPRLVSADGQAAMALVSLPTTFISPITARAVDAIEKTLRQTTAPEGLNVEITDNAVFGRDFALKTQEALGRTTLVTIVAVLVILVLVYRSPVGVVVPLVSIGSSVFLAFVVLAGLAKAGWEVSDMERIFAVVLIFGAGVDYALFWISRYREALRGRLDFDAAAVSASRFAGPAIVAGAATTICGLTTLVFTELGPTRNAGKILAIVLTIALLAALTLAPAMSRILRGALFWPVGAAGGRSIGERVFWPRLAVFVSRKPALCLLGGVLLLGVPALCVLRFPVRFDSLTDPPPDSASARGLALLGRHFDKAHLYSSALAIEFERPVESAELHRLSRSIADRILRISGVHDVYSLDAPLGRNQPAEQSTLVKSLLPLIAGEFYVSQSARVVRMEILINDLPFTPQAMAVMEQATAIARQEAGRLTAGSGAVHVLGTGLTPYILSIRDVVISDQWRIMLLATAVIGLIVLALIRRMLLTLFMLLATWLTYGATITFSSLFFIHWMGSVGLDWKVRLIVFVIVVAVGQDYNVFLAARLFQELPQAGKAEAARRAIVSTGAVISNCGLIMAATLGSLWAGRLPLLQQVGFSVALGVLIDTFFVRPVLIPSFFLAVGRYRRAGAAADVSLLPIGQAAAAPVPTGRGDAHADAADRSH